MTKSRILLYLDSKVEEFKFKLESTSIDGWKESYYQNLITEYTTIIEYVKTL